MKRVWPLKRFWLGVLFAAALATTASVRGQETEAPGAEVPQAGDAAEPGSELAARQEQVAERFRELERLLLRMAELTAPTDPRRSALLRRAVAQSKDRAIDQQFDALVELLRKERLAAVVKSQGSVQDDLVKLLELLLSEDRTKRIKNEKEQIREYLKRVNKIIRVQKGVQGETQRDGETGELADKQGELSDDTGQLAEDIRGEELPSEENPAKESDEKPDSKESDPMDAKESDEKKPGEADEQGKPADSQDGKPQDGKPQDGKPQDGKPQDGKPQDGKPQDGKPQDGKPQDGKPQDGKPQDGKPQDAPPVDPPEQQPEQGEQAQQNPAQQRLEQAQQRMQEAQKKLEEAQREDAAEKQAEALRELERAKAELEEILRQLREEEMSRTLAMLEARFRKMLDAQIEVYEGTKRLDDVPEERRDRDDVIEAGRLGRKEAEIAVEAEKALAVLREEGSAVAFPEAVTEIRDDMITVRDRLAEAKTAAMTQGLEEDIIAALEEMITALEKAQKEMENKPNQPPPNFEAGDGEMPLVDSLSEIKMIRALQMRVNTRTQRFGELAASGEVDQADLLEGLRRLAEREQRIHKVTRDIVVGRNR